MSGMSSSAEPIEDGLDERGHDSPRPVDRGESVPTAGSRGVVHDDSPHPGERGVGVVTDDPPAGDDLLGFWNLASGVVERGEHSKEQLFEMFTEIKRRRTWFGWRAPLGDEAWNCRLLFITTNFARC